MIATAMAEITLEKEKNARKKVQVVYGPDFRTDGLLDTNSKMSLSCHINLLPYHYSKNSAQKRKDMMQYGNTSLYQSDENLRPGSGNDHRP